ncbi:protein rep [Leptolyngbya sp. AN03gr2]|uniref:protein rep n=1 Tax=unclassified Leptolyngbya TaxID=2650499 RepID=UPI003D30F6FA
MTNEFRLHLALDISKIIMLDEAEIKSGQPHHLDWLCQLKAQAESLADRLEQIQSPYAQRMAHCADVVTIQQFANGFQRLKNTQFCRVLGCPVCEHLRRHIAIGKLKHILHKAKKISSAKLRLISFPLPPHLIEDSESYRNLAQTALKQIRKLKIWKAHGSVCLLEVSTIGTQILVQYHIITIVPASSYGCHYIKKSVFQELWETRLQMQCPEIRIVNASADFKADIKAVLRQVNHAGYLPLSLAENSQLISMMKSFLSTRFFNASGICKDWLRQVDEKPSYPSTLKRLELAQTIEYAFLPNPASDLHKETYLTFTVPSLSAENN